MSMRSDQPETWSGRLSDGHTAGSVVAAVQLSEAGVQISPPQAAEPLVWSATDLGVATPVTRRAKDILLTHAQQPGATLFVDDAAFVRRVTKLAPHLSARAYGWRATRPLLLAAIAVAAVVVAIWQLNLSPANVLARFMPDGLRRSMGENVVTVLRGKRRNCDHPAGKAALDQLVQRLSKASGTPARFTVWVVDWSLMNAFAAPGEQIMLTKGIITAAESPEEVAGIIAHEMGHGLHLHPESGLIRVIGVTAALELMTGGGGGVLVSAGLLLTQLGYSRAAERQADDVALHLLHRARISNRGMTDFFNRISKLEGDRAGPGAQLLRSHPQSAERASRVAARPDYATTPALSDAEWQALRAICAAAD